MLHLVIVAVLVTGEEGTWHRSWQGRNHRPGPTDYVTCVQDFGCTTRMDASRAKETAAIPGMSLPVGGEKQIFFDRPLVAMG